eukprot:9779214-Lingulodinium_polyedra.AAC.1
MGVARTRRTRIPGRAPSRVWRADAPARGAWAQTPRTPMRLARPEVGRRSLPSRRTPRAGLH